MTQNQPLLRTSLPPHERLPSLIGEWASENAGSASDAELAQQAGVTKTHLNQCRRIWEQLDPRLHWLVDTGRLPLSHANVIVRLESKPEQRLLSAAVLHEAEVAQSPVNAQTLGAVIRCRKENPRRPLEDIMSEIAGVRFSSQLNTVSVCEDLPALHEASWQWKDPSLADYVAQAPYRLMMICKLMRGIAVFPMPGSPEEIHINVSLDISPKGVMGKDGA